MLLVKTKLAPSKIEGMGVFAEQFIPEGTRVWQFIPGFDVERSEEEVRALPDSARKWIERYGYFDRNLHTWIICLDDARFINHSGASNAKADYSLDKYGIDIAARDIQSGEEITVDYRLFEDQPPPGE